MIAVVDYQKGNLKSVERGLIAAGGEAEITADAAEIARAEGDLEVDGHHTVEDVGIVAGQAFARALGDKRGIRRFGSIALPMDEALILAAVDISGRGQLFWEADVPAVMVGAFDATLAKEFFIAFAANAGVTLHIRELAGENTHHVIEGMFKAVARAMRQAVEPDPRMGDALPTTKGAL